MVNTYTPLHVHSMYSLLDGFSTPEEYLKRCEELGIKNIAITEHGNQLSWLYFSKLSEKYSNIKILYGVEMYETEDLAIQDKDSKYYHLVAIAKNERGRKALNKLVTISNIEGFYYKPRITIEHMKQYAEDLIVLSACLASKIAREQDFDKCLEYVKEYKSIFPHFYLEMQSHKTEDQKVYNNKILKLSEITDTPYVITTDAHSATEEELKYQGYHVQIAQDRETMGETYSGCYIQSVEEIHEIMDSQIGSERVDIGLEETNKIADLCDVVQMPFQKPKLPHYELPEGFESNKEFIRHLCEIGWQKRKIDSMTEEEIQIRRERMEYELSVINQMDFDGYFIILWDALEYARKQNVIIGAGRGSAAGSLVCYLLNITDIDPIKYDLIFERFLNPERVSYPDVDVDTNNRELIINYLMGKYGENKVCQVLNFSYITPVVAIKDVASKILKIPYNIANTISKRFNYPTFKECIDNNPNIYNEYPEYKEWFDIAEKLSGKIRHCSVHAGGVGIVDGEMEDYIGLRLGSDGSHVIQADKRVVEEIGIVKYDLLGVKTLNIVEEARKDAGLSDWDLNINNPNFEFDEKSYELICSGNTDLVFQMESSGMKELATKAQPKSVEDLSAVIALYRPDSMPFIPDYLRGKVDRKSIEYIHPDMEDILSKTYGALIYQEQILEILRKFGGRSYGGADIMRKLLGKKLVELIKPEVEKLEGEIINNGYSKEISRTICSLLVDMGNYCFNSSHSLSYSVLCLQTAYLKAHHPLEFYKASFNTIDKSTLSRYIVDANRNGIQIVPPNINKSEIGFSIQDGKIMFGLSSIKGLGEVVAQAIIEERATNGRFTSLDDFITRCNVSDSLLVTLTKAGALPVKNKKEFLTRYINKQYEFKYKPVTTLPTLKKLENEWRIDLTQYKTKDERLEIYNKKKEEVEKVKFEEKKEKGIQEFVEKYMQDEDLWEFETLSTFITNNPFEKIYKSGLVRAVEDIEEESNGVLVGVVSKIQKKKDKNKNQFAYVEMFSAYGTHELICWAKQYKQFEPLLKKNSKLAFFYKKKDDKLITVQIKPYEQWEKEVVLD